MTTSARDGQPVWMSVGERITIRSSRAPGSGVIVMLADLAPTGISTLPGNGSKSFPASASPLSLYFTVNAVVVGPLRLMRNSPG